MRKCDGTPIGIPSTQKSQAVCFCRAKVFRTASFTCVNQMWLPHGSCCSSRTKGREWSLTCTFSRSPSRLSPVTVPQRVRPSSSVQPMRTSIPHWHGLESVLLHCLPDGLQGVSLHAVKDSHDGLGHGCSCYHKLSVYEKHSFKRNRRYSASSLPRSTASSMTQPSSSKYTSSPMHSVPA